MINELDCINAFIKLGYAVSIPYGDYCRYDFIADVNNKLFRVQCKAAAHRRVDQNIVSIKCYSNVYTTKTTKQKKYSKDEIDLLATYYDGKCFVVPIEECADKSSFNIDVQSEKYLLENAVLV